MLLVACRILSQLSYQICQSTHFSSFPISSTLLRTIDQRWDISQLSSLFSLSQLLLRYRSHRQAVCALMMAIVWSWVSSSAWNMDYANLGCSKVVVHARLMPPVASWGALTFFLSAFGSDVVQNVSCANLGWNLGLVRCLLVVGLESQEYKSVTWMFLEEGNKEGGLKRELWNMLQYTLLILNDTLSFRKFYPSTEYFPDTNSMK